jgi:hypothetical protein
MRWILESRGDAVKDGGVDARRPIRIEFLRKER